MSLTLFFKTSLSLHHCFNSSVDDVVDDDDDDDDDVVDDDDDDDDDVVDERRFKSHSIFYRSAETAISSSDAENGLCGPVAVKRLKFGRLIYFYSFSSYTTV